MLVGAAAREQNEVSWVKEFLKKYFRLALFRLYTLYNRPTVQLWELAASKGQLTSKGLFGIFNSSKKTNITIRPN